MSNVSRRNFFKGAGAAALVAAAAGSLSGCGNGYESNEPVKNDTTQRPSGPSWLGEAPQIDETEITETLDYEVVVVGLRTGGLPALMSAAENGARVLGIEQMSKIAEPREDLGAVNSRYQLESFSEFPQFEIDKMEIMEDIVRYANGFVNYDLIKLWVDESGDMINWLSDIIERDGKFKMWFEGSVGTEGQGARDKAWATGHSPQKLVDDKEITFGGTMRDYAIENGAEIRYDTMLVKCEQDESGRVTGVICRDGNDLHYIRVNASKGVILATGGYVANTEMVEARQAWNNRLKINIPVGGSCTGDGIKAAMWCGATIDPLGCAVTFNRACCKPDEVAGGDLVGKWFWFGEQPFLKVNLQGKRFCNESGPYDYMLHSAFMQPYHTYVDIWDSDYVTQVKQINEVGCCRLYPFDNGAPSNMDISAMQSKFDQLEEAGYVQKADTMEDCHVIDVCLNATVCKNLFLCNRQKTNFYLLMMPGDKPFKTKELSHQLGIARLSFASPEDMEQYLDCTPGSSSIMGLANDTENKVQLLMDEDIKAGEYLGCHPCINTSSLAFSTQDLTEKLLPALGHAPVLVDLPEDSDA